MNSATFVETMMQELRHSVRTLRLNPTFTLTAVLTLAIGTIFFWQVTVNVGMTTGVLPVVGVPLPLFSYGGSSLFSLLIGIGLVMNVSMRRNLF